MKPRGGGTTGNQVQWKLPWAKRGQSCICKRSGNANENCQKGAKVAYANEVEMQIKMAKNRPNLHLKIAIFFKNFKFF